LGVLGVLGGAAANAWPRAARAQQAMPLIMIFNSGKANTQVKNMAQLRQGLRDSGIVEGRDAAIEFRWGENQFDRLPALAAEVVAQRPAVIVSNTLAARAAKAATATIPIVFTTGSDPVPEGLVPSLSKPGGNLTGVAFISGTLGAKRLELLRQLVPKVKTVALMLYPATAETEAERKDVQAAAQAIGAKLVAIEVKSPDEIEAAFATLGAGGADALLAGTGPFLFNNRKLIVALAARHAVPAMYSQREAVEAGGLMSYGASISEAFRQAGLYVGRILKGERPADLPVILSSKFEFVINLKTAKALGLEFHPQLLAIADEVIE
jgi:putative ABC transport system substrate-binding protein